MTSFHVKNINNKKIQISIFHPFLSLALHLRIMSKKKQIGKETLNPLAVAKLLGPSNPKLDHLIRFLNSVRGTDKVLMVSLKINDNQGEIYSVNGSLFNIGQKSLFGTFNVVHLL